MRNLGPVACDFITTPTKDGKHKHVCRVCGTQRVTKRPKHVRECSRQPEAPGVRLHWLVWLCLDVLMIPFRVAAIGIILFAAWLEERMEDE